MLRAFAHEAVLSMSPEGDVGAPGAAITVELCGHWEHAGPCPVAPHHTDVARVGDELRIRILFAADEQQQEHVRLSIERALRRGLLRGQNGGTTAWELRDSQPGVVRADELELAGRLLSG